MQLAFTSPSDNFHTLVTLLIIWASAILMAELFERLRQPAVVGQILAGIIIGPSVLALVQPNEITSTLAEIGVIFLLFTVGLETKPHDILRVGKSAFLVAVLGVIVPFVAGYVLMELWGAPNIESLFIGTAMVATSVGITAKVLGDLGLIEHDTSRIILGAAVIDDILGLLVLAVVSSLAQGSINYLELALTAALSIGFLIFVMFVGAPAVTRMAPRIENLRLANSLFAFGLVLCLALSVAAAYIGVAAIVGAFVAGMSLAEATEDNPTMHKQIAGVTDFLVPFFLVGIGLQLKLDVFRDSSTLALTAIITVVAVITKLIGGGLGVLNLGWRKAGQVGVGMIPRGEVGIVVAQIGLGMSVITDSLYGVVLFMAVATTIVAPPLLKVLFKGEGAVAAE
ncbi:MAG: cation:proton antiporter [Chloracidobacterium sp.]|nr:cation:proton antiporter [Chloracidobacterium sp.]MCO5333722.1 cation:proton antiporter [Pyrinomonadaceae bacterium]